MELLSLAQRGEPVSDEQWLFATVVRALIILQSVQCLVQNIAMQQTTLYTWLAWLHAWHYKQ
jgi:hypothetical protein